MSCSTSFSNNQLKLIAAASMLLDHIGMLLFPRVPWLRILGRLAMPLFAYMIAEGCAHTRHRTRYLLSVAALAVLCQVFYTSATGSLYQNILVTFTFAIALIFCLDRLTHAPTLPNAALAATVCGAALFAEFVLPSLLPTFRLDYGLFGMFLPIAVYLAPHKPLKLAATASVLTGLALCAPPIQWAALLSLPLLALYNGQRGRHDLKWCFYVFYPLHLALLQLLKLWLF